MYSEVRSGMISVMGAAAVSLAKVASKQLLCVIKYEDM